MDEAKIRALEPKYTGNERHLSEGEAYEIINEANYDDNDDEVLELIPFPLNSRLSDTQ
ncbi:MAG: hypothetical protein K0Q59_2004 [Paenibacillus sp.]|nr:hypothetical protein [Paenibacillus sp.]